MEVTVLIPHSLVKLNLSSSSLESISLEELSPKSMRFYLPKDVIPDISRSFKLTLYHPISHHTYTHLFQYSDCISICCEDYRTLWEVRVHDSDYARCVTAFSKEYLSYISAKIEADDEELAEQLTALPHTPHEFSSNLTTWQKKHLSTLKADEHWLSLLSSVAEKAIFLHTHEQYARFLSMPFSNFLKDYWTRHHISSHECCQLTINHLYLGSTTCRFLVPSFEEFLFVFKKAVSEQIYLSLVFPPMSLGQESFYRQYFMSLNNAVSSNYPEIIVNDLGAVQYIRELCPSFPIRLGLLMNRTPKDPRTTFLPYSDFTKSSLFCQESYLQQLLSSALSDFSSDAVDSLLASPGSLAFHLPFSMTNYTPRCTLDACLRYADRGYQKHSSCSFSCKDHLFLYPDSLKMLGISNALWSFNESLMTSSDALSPILSAPVNRIVFDFLQEGSL